MYNVWFSTAIFSSLTSQTTIYLNKCTFYSNTKNIFLVRNLSYAKVKRFRFFLQLWHCEIELRMSGQFLFLELWTTAVNLINQKVMQKHSCSLCPAANLCICLQHCSVVSKYLQSLQTKSKIDNIVSSCNFNY